MAPILPLVEAVAQGDKTDRLIEATMEVIKAVGKMPVR